MTNALTIGKNKTLQNLVQRRLLWCQFGSFSSFPEFIFSQLLGRYKLCWKGIFKGWPTNKHSSTYVSTELRSFNYFSFTTLAAECWSSVWTRPSLKVTRPSFKSATRPSLKVKNKAVSTQPRHAAGTAAVKFRWARPQDQHKRPITGVRRMMPLERAVSARPSATRRASPSGGRQFTLPLGRELGNVCRGLQTRTGFRRTPRRSGASRPVSVEPGMEGE